MMLALGQLWYTAVVGRDYKYDSITARVSNGSPCRIHIESALSIEKSGPFSPFVSILIFFKASESMT